MASAIVTANAVHQPMSEMTAAMTGKATGRRDKATDVAEKAASCLMDSLQTVLHDVFPLDRDLSKTHGRDSYEEFYGYNTVELATTESSSRRSSTTGVHLPDQDLTLKDADMMEAGAGEISVDVESDAEKSWGLLHRVSELFPHRVQKAGDADMDAEAVERELQKVRRQESKRTGEITALLARGWMSPESVRRLKEELREMQAKTAFIREGAGSFSSTSPKSSVASGEVTPVSRAQSWHGAVEFGPSIGLPSLLPAANTAVSRLAPTPEGSETPVEDHPFPSFVPAPAKKTTCQEPSASAKSPPFAVEQKSTQQDAPSVASTAESATPPAAAPSKGKGKGKVKGGKGPPVPPPTEEPQLEATHGVADSAGGSSAPEVEEPTSPPPIQADAKAAPPATKGKGKGAKGDSKGAKGNGKGALAGPGGPPKAGGKGGAKAKAKATVALPKGKPIGRRFDWKMLGSDKVEGTVFANLSAKMQKVSVDVTRLRSLFEMPKEKEAKAKSSATAPPKPVLVEVLAHSRAQNVMIALRKQPLTPVVVKALEELDFEAAVLTPEAIEILIGAVPTAEEAKAIVGHRPEALRGVERQILPLARMEQPVAGQRLRVMLFNKMMKELSKDAKTGLGLLHGALEDAQNSPAFRTVLCHTMRLGSIINFGNAPKPETGEGSGDTDHPATPVGGFCLDALSRLALFRAPGNARITLLHVLAAQLCVEDASLHSRLQDEIGKVHKAAKRSLASLSDDVGAFNREAEFFTNCAAGAGGASSSDAVVVKLVRFSEQATAEAAALVQQLEEARAVAKATLAFFAMQARPAEVDAKALELCMLLSEFLVAFEKARKEITKRPDLAVMCHGGTAEVLAKLEQDSPVPPPPPRGMKTRAKTEPVSTRAPAETDTPADAAASALPAAAAAQAGGAIASAEVSPVDELAMAASTAAAAAGDMHSIEATSAASASAVAAPAADAPPADVSGTMVREAQSVRAVNPATTEPSSADASARSLNTYEKQDSPQSLHRTNSFMALITDEVEAAAAVETDAAAAANVLDSTANTLPGALPGALQRSDSFMALITDKAEAADKANALDSTANTA